MLSTYPIIDYQYYEYSYLQAVDNCKVNKLKSRICKKLLKTYLIFVDKDAYKFPKTYMPKNLTFHDDSSL